VIVISQTAISTKTSALQSLGLVDKNFPPEADPISNNPVYIPDV
jgi:hypothetical protein